MLAVAAKVGPVTVVQQTVDICKLSTEQGFPCPIAAGQQTLNITVVIPENTPKLSYNIKGVAKNADGKQIVCIEGSVKVALVDNQL